MKCASAVILLCILVAACSPTDPGTVVTYGDSTISDDELKTELAKGVYADLAADPDRRLHLALRELVLQIWAAHESLSEEEERALQQHRLLQGMTQCVSRRMRALFLETHDIETAVDAYFRDHPGEFDQTERFQLQLIFLPRSEAGAGALARRLFAELEQNPDLFGKLAYAHSRSQTAVNGGVTAFLEGSAVDAQLRRTVSENRSGAPFLLGTDRGWYIVRVLEFVDPMVATVEMVRPQVLERIQDDFEAQLKRELIKEWGGSAPDFEIDNRLFHLPIVPGDTEISDELLGTMKARDLIPPTGANDTVSGPVFRAAVDRLSDLRVFAGHFDCEPDRRQEPPARSTVAAHRLPTMVPEILAANHREELERFFELHRGALAESPVYVVDLAVFPYRSANGFADLESYRPIMDALASDHPPTSQSISDAGVILVDDLRITEDQLAAYDEDLVTAVRTIRPGLFSHEAASDPAQAFLMIRLVDRQPARPLDPEDTDDLATIARAMITADADAALDLVYSTLTTTLVEVDLDAARIAAEPYFEGGSAGELD